MVPAEEEQGPVCLDLALFPHPKMEGGVNGWGPHTSAVGLSYADPILFGKRVS